MDLKRCVFREDGDQLFERCSFWGYTVFLNLTKEVMEEETCIALKMTIVKGHIPAF